MQAYGMQAEIGLKVVSAGLGGYDGPEWARESRIEEAIGQRTKVCQQLASLRPFRSHFSIMRAHHLLLQNQVKACRATLKREINGLNTADHSSTVYTCYFTYITVLLSSTSAQPPDYSNALSTLQKVQSIAHSRGDHQISTLALATRLQVLMYAELWELVGETCDSTDGETNGLCRHANGKPGIRVLIFRHRPDATLALHEDSSSHAEHPLSHSNIQLQIRFDPTHDLLDSDVLENFPTGALNVTCTVGPPVHLNVTHPSIFRDLAVRTLINLFSSIPGSESTRKPVLEDSIAWARQEKRIFLKQSLETRLVALHLEAQSYRPALSLIDGLPKELKRPDDKLILTEVHLLESRVYSGLIRAPYAP
ncbi:26S proteasome regulatory subunit rpn6 [Tulasnella sp. 424]|nr:26S proteasome regulatory subunit rpn6 [Tulasnella sp. 424]